MVLLDVFLIKGVRKKMLLPNHPVVRDDLWFHQPWQWKIIEAEWLQPKKWANTGHKGARNQRL